MKLVFMGTPEFAVPILNNLIKEFDVILVVTQPDKPVGRKRIMTAPPVKKVAIEANIPVFQPIKLRDDYQKIIDLKPDYIITAAYGQMLPKRLIEAIHAINVHGSILPSYRGGAPIQKAIMNLDNQTGITIMKMEYKMDSGDIYYQESLPILPNDTTTTLTNKLSFLGADMIIHYLKNIQLYPPIKQDEDEVSFAYNITFEDQIINWNQTEEFINAHVRAMLDDPGAVTYYNNHILKIYETKKSDIITNEVPGTIISLDKKIAVSCINGAIEIEKLQLSGKKMMSAKEFLNGQTILKVGTTFGKEENYE